MLSSLLDKLSIAWYIDSMVDKQEIFDLRIAGKTYQGIADLYGISRQRIHQLLTGYKSDTKEYKRRLRIRIKELILTHYGNKHLACVKCGFTDIRALTIDHINGGGSKHMKELNLSRRGFPFYDWLRKNHYPEGYQTLCMNCQLIKRFENKEW